MTKTKALPAPLREYLSDAALPAPKDIVATDPDRLWEFVQRGMEMEIKGKIAAGWALTQLRDNLPPQVFSSKLRDLNIPRSSAYDAIAASSLFATLPDLQVVRALAQLGIAKTLTLRTWEPKEVVALASGKPVRGLTLDAAVEMPTREFADAVRDPELIRANKKIAGLEADNEGLTEEIKSLKGALKHRYQNLRMPDFAAHARQESVALAEQMTLGITALEDLLQQNLVEGKEAKLHPEWAERAAGTMYHSLRSVQARLEAVLFAIQEQYGSKVTGKVDYEHRLSEGELLIARDSLAVVLSRHKDDAHNREADRQNAKGGRGRPMKKKAVQ
jgi:hypothetical protein